MSMLVLYGAVFFFAFLSFGLAGTLYLVARRDDEAAVTLETIADAMDAAIAVVDERGTVLFANGAFVSLSDGSPEGKSVDAVLTNHPELTEAVESDTDIAEIETDDGTRHLQCERFVTSSQDGDEQTVLFFHDVTDHCESRHELEAQNERLDEFASLITHDIRNPLDVAIGRTNAANELTDNDEVSELLAGVRDSHDRILRIINNVLALARDGDAIENLESVSVAEAAETAWSHVETTDETLEIHYEGVILADRACLERLFENLFRNAVEHCGGGVTVTVEPLADGPGFAVADDGPGIPEAERDAVLQAGYSVHSTGTGLGLAIVSRIAESHDWDITVTESAAGGAQFEFSGVDSPAQGPDNHSEHRTVDTAAAETE